MTPHSLDGRESSITFGASVGAYGFLFAYTNTYTLKGFLLKKIHGVSVMLSGVKKEAIALMPLQLGLPLSRCVGGYLPYLVRERGCGAWLEGCHLAEPLDNLRCPCAWLGSYCSYQT